MSVEEALEFFESRKNDSKEIEAKLLSKIMVHLNALMETGLPYLSLGQPLSTLSGGERQRVKLAKDLNKKGSIFILDEPTTGLHSADIKSIMKLLESFVVDTLPIIAIWNSFCALSWPASVGASSALNDPKDSRRRASEPCALWPAYRHS